MVISQMEAIGREIRAAVVRRGWSVQDLATNLGVPYGSLSRYLRGERDFPATMLLDALRMLDVSLHDFDARVNAAGVEVTDQIVQDFRGHKK